MEYSGKAIEWKEFICAYSYRGTQTLMKGGGRVAGAGADWSHDICTQEAEEEQEVAPGIKPQDHLLVARSLQKGSVS